MVARLLAVHSSSVCVRATGGTVGIGPGIARALAGAGPRVFVSGHSGERHSRREDEHITAILAPQTLVDV
jgi:NAD(P)-dependent dehydrogenase (short-subunit alcohol dehydrogenase family)